MSRYFKLVERSTEEIVAVEHSITFFVTLTDGTDVVFTKKHSPSVEKLDMVRRFSDFELENINISSVTIKENQLDKWFIPKIESNVEYGLIFYANGSYYAPNRVKTYTKTIDKTNVNLNIRTFGLEEIDKSEYIQYMITGTI